MTSPPVSVPDVYRLVGERIRGERNRRNLTQEELATRVRLKRTSITNIEKGRQKLLLHTFVEIAAALSISPRDLIAVLEPAAAGSLETTLPPNLSPSVKDWIMSGVATAHTRKKR